MISLHIPVFLPMLLGTLGYFMPRRMFYWTLLAVQAAQVLLTAAVFISVRRDGAILQQLGSWPSGMGIALYADILSTTMLLLTSLLFFAFLLYNAKDHYTDNLFMFLFMLMQTVQTALFLSNDLFNVYVLLELSMIIVTILIMYKHKQQSLYDGMIYIMLNSVGMAFLLFGVGFLYRMTGVLDFDGISRCIAAAGNRRMFAAPFALIMTGLAVKAAMFPLFSWLPRAHGAPSAPSIVSAMLSGLLVKVGVFMLLRLNVVFAPAFNADNFFFAVAFCTAVAGFALALCQNDLKLILAYHTISQVGLIVMGLSAGNEYAYWGGVYHIINHAFFKGLLFLSAGVIIEEYGTRDYTRIQGVLARMPLIGVTAAMGVLGITGAPFFNGSVSKYLIQRGLQGDFRELAILLVNLGTIVSFVKYSSILPSASAGAGFSRLLSKWRNISESAATHESQEKKVGTVHQNRNFQSFVSICLGAVCLAGGIAGASLTSALFQVELDVGGAFYLSKSIMFVLTFLLGIVIYRFAIISLKPFFKIIQNKIITFNDATLCISLFCLLLGAYVYFLA